MSDATQPQQSEQSQYGQQSYPTSQQPQYSDGQQQPAKTPPQNPKRPWYKKWWVWLIAVFLFFGFIGALGGGSDESANTDDATTGAAETTLSEEEQTSLEAEESADAEASASASAAAASESAAAASESAAAASASAAAAAEASASAEAARLDPASYSAISDRDWQILARDANSHIGEKYVIYGYVTQADQATGTEAFRANTGGEKKSSWYDYDVNTIVVADESLVSQVITDDLVTMYVEVLMAYEYDTSIGGTATAVMVSANMLEVTGAAD